MRKCSSSKRFNTFAIYTVTLIAALILVTVQYAQAQLTDTKVITSASNNGTITNDEDITISAGSTVTGNSALYLDATTNITLRNFADLTVTTNDYGIRSLNGSNNTFINYGTIISKNDAILIRGDNETLINYGTILTGRGGMLLGYPSKTTALLSITAR
ncbi:MAG: hypothetical protein R2568_10605 [Candidatus Scalindua sp.]|jgi:hypothetical protein|nr:hypothetical protein [Candidatus Scalindua sp.]MDV5167177.1 hypothetical protein [Candidatus Scalindua sp.]